MQRKLIAIVMLAFCMICANISTAAELSIKSGDNIQKILEDHKGKRVTVRMNGSDELTGKVRVVTKELLHLGELASRDYFDAVIDISRISAVIIRVKE